ncbi:tryptophan synthase subunit alpha [Saccharicrinis fermentans]|uniref:Tryptophan synthase alpha chain n=1 Tax=Saccharicrinis fermentans DSM 9555 = JCM 21142 TaxID=869213 RepID=W7Y9R0_9BACT|nr:tryptophan synthase subunit alpha [Saccharicrinis fermentans]GAF04248.1 tryptophan synthase alpha chain [Saccharicrinis fermentans DSM 9555 = JCM 21142]
MNRIKQLFQDKKDILSIYYTAGYPQLGDTVPILESLEEAGADLVEIGIPFSDPLADGPTIQHSGQRALENGMSLQVLFKQLEDVRTKVKMPLVLMGYINTVYKFGIENFAKRCSEVGVDGVILPDLPFQVYLDEYKETFDRYGVSNVFLITPQTPEERIKLIDEKTNGFIYMVSSASVTGAKKGLSDQQLAYFERVSKLKLTNPALIGFGISDRASYIETCKYADGAIIGSAFVKLLGEAGDMHAHIKSFIQGIK